MSKIVIFGILIVVALLIGASAVFAQDATPGATVGPVCPNLGGTAPGGAGATPSICQSAGGATAEQRQQMQDAMGQAMQSGDMQQMRNTCQTYRNAQTSST